MTKRSLFLAAATATLLAGCGTSNRGMESYHQPVVQRTDYAFDVQAGGDGLAPGEAQKLDGWLQAMRIGYGDTVAVDGADGSGRAREDIAQVAARYGLLLAEQAPVTNAPVAPGTARVVVSRTSASVPGCPDYSRMYQPNFNQHASSNYGCATNSNLAAMIANPADLVRGAPGSGGYDAAAGTRAIAELRAAKPTGEGGTWVKSKAEAGGKK